MKLYLIKANGGQRYGGSMADVRTARAELAAKLGIKKSEVTVEDVDVPTNKPGILKTLNELCEKLDREQP